MDRMDHPMILMSLMREEREDENNRMNDGMGFGDR